MTQAMVSLLPKTPDALTLSLMRVTYGFAIAPAFVFLLSRLATTEPSWALDVLRLLSEATADLTITGYAARRYFPAPPTDPIQLAKVHLVLICGALLAAAILWTVLAGTVLLMRHVLTNRRDAALSGPDGMRILSGVLLMLIVVLVLCNGWPFDPANQARGRGRTLHITGFLGAAFFTGFASFLIWSLGRGLLLLQPRPKPAPPAIIPP